ncbi:MAG: hypothetical protein JXR21_03070 [Candidatus Marinimicrobia bacterium]|nr:hypothetical protein [Candidatus Neomarinimicrobiota bacterium]
MKKSPILLIILVLLLVMSNPSKDDFFEWVNNQMLEQSETTLEGVLTNLLATPILKSATLRKDYVVCSLYIIELNDEKDTYLGILKRFVKIEI